MLFEIKKQSYNWFIFMCVQGDHKLTPATNPAKHIRFVSFLLFFSCVLFQIDVSRLLNDT